MFTSESLLASRAERNAKWVVLDGVVHIPLPCGREALIDECDKELASKFTWSSMPTPSGVVYAGARVPKAMRDEFNCKTIKLHSLVFAVPSGFQPDHKDRNGLNCCRSNLRIATRSQNGANRSWPQGKRSKYRGVFPCFAKWGAQIQVQRKIKYLGLFTTERDAAAAYNCAAIKYHGEYAILNEAHEGLAP